MDDDYSNSMDYDAYNDSQDSESQSQTQSTQQATQPTTSAVDAHLWGYLQPCSASLTRIDFWKSEPKYTIGRNTEINKVILPGFKISNRHCEISWDGEVNNSVVVLDLSSNGTFINNVKIGKNQTRILREGNEIAFGTPVPQLHNDGLEDYRFVYRHTASGPPTTGLYAYYDISNELGKGSFATVMKAINRSSGEWYAVKMIKDKGNHNGQDHGHSRSSTIAREISIMEKLKHPNICELKEVFYQEDSNDINLVLELVEGGDLLEYILKSSGLCEVDAQHITYQICDALAYIHSQGVAHRDLKPENVLLTRDNPPIVKVADFGLAKIVDSLTMLRTMCGTPSYLAPEVVKQQNHEGYDNLVDSWSVGVIVFSMLTNSSPFVEDENQRDIRTRIAERKVDWGTLANHSVSLEAESFIRALLQEDPRQRMSLTDSILHPWLQSYTPVHIHSHMSGVRGTAPSAGVSHDFIGLQIQPSPSSSVNGITREASRTAPLQRRSQVLSQAAEDGRSVPEPSPEMIANAAAKEQANVKKGKRVRANLTPLQEEGSVPKAGPSSGKAPKRPRLRSED